MKMKFDRRSMIDDRCYYDRPKHVYYVCTGTHVACDVRHRRALDSSSGTVAFHVFLPR